MAGRPSKYKEEYCQQLIAHMAEGYSYESFAGKIKVNTDTLNEWVKVHPEFSVAKKDGRMAGLYYDEQILKGLIVGKIKGNIVGQIFKFKCRYREFGWKDEDSIGDAMEKIEIHVRKSLNES